MEPTINQKVAIITEKDPIKQLELIKKYDAESYRRICKAKKIRKDINTGNTDCERKFEDRSKKM